MRFDWCVAVACVAAGLAGQGAQAQSAGPARPGAYGGGFIEFLMSDDRAPRQAVPVRGGPIPLADAGVPPRHASPYGYGGPGSPRMLHSGERVPEEREPPIAYAPATPAPAARVRLAALPQPRAVEPAVETIARAPDPRYGRQVVAYDGPQRPGAIVVDTPAKFLYLVQPGGQAIRYGIGVGRPGFAWSGLKTISQKREWPDWTPPPEMVRRRPDLPRHMAGGPGNPLGARALYLGSSLYRIHGTNEPHTIGQNVSSGCIRMMNEDVIDLYERTPVGTRVEVL
ncbi:L,D-transpeptidase [Methylobacterium sp. J-068]|uniref:L,D-transpeptidase n=1 Tax=Methylobacterium sp. J-068 TaxID=2836649 RepID=UPI001FBB8B1A|nr:L,D-transpeptidase [Methylobacterium sp. J-068]MCJ2034745.1 L,D-transpeptidase [Methylobacterium sp. J-068]